VGTTVEDVRVNLGRSNVTVAEKLLNRADVVAVLQQMRCEAVPAERANVNVGIIKGRQ
jgi:hypothetical protein